MTSSFWRQNGPKMGKSDQKLQKSYFFTRLWYKVGWHHIWKVQQWYIWENVKEMAHYYLSWYFFIRKSAKIRQNPENHVWRHKMTSSGRIFSKFSENVHFMHMELLWKNEIICTIFRKVMTINVFYPILPHKRHKRHFCVNFQYLNKHSFSTNHRTRAFDPSLESQNYALHENQHLADSCMSIFSQIRILFSIFWWKCHVTSRDVTISNFNQNLEKHAILSY